MLREIDLSNVNWWFIQVAARVSFLSTADGGRRHPIWENYSPNHRLEDGSFCMGRFTSVDGGHIAPGEGGLVEIKFVVIEPLRHFFKEGMVWDIQEGGKKVGSGVILSIIEEEKVPKD